MVAPGTTAPCASLTPPRMAPVGACADAADAASTTPSAAPATVRIHDRSILATIIAPFPGFLWLTCRSGDNGRGKRRPCDEHRGAAQARMLLGGNDDEVRRSGCRRQCALGERRANGTLDEIPGGRDLAA